MSLLDAEVCEKFQRMFKITQTYQNETSVRDHSRVYVKYGVATISRLLKIIGLFCRISSVLKSSCVKETYNFKESTNVPSRPLSRAHVSVRR